MQRVQLCFQQNVSPTLSPLHAHAHAHCIPAHTLTVLFFIFWSRRFLFWVGGAKKLPLVTFYFFGTQEDEPIILFSKSTAP